MKKLLYWFLGIILILLVVMPMIGMAGLKLAELYGYWVTLASIGLICIYVASYSRPLPVPFNSSNSKKGIIIAVCFLFTILSLVGASDRQRLDNLKEDDPVAYLEEIKVSDEPRWIVELEELYPERYAIEKPLYDQRVAEAKAKMAAEEQIKRQTELAEEKIKQEERLAEEAADRQKELAKAKAIAEEKRCGRDTEASAWAKSEVRESLKNPDSADFPWLPDEVNRLECGRWKVRSFVDATNGFGATVRTKFLAIMRKVDQERWVLEELKTW